MEPGAKIELAHATLRSALSTAERLQLVSVNAAELVSVPKPKAHPIALFDFDQAKAFLKAADKYRLGTLFSVAVACGLRLGEATGLKWNDVDLATGEVRVRPQLQVVNKQLVLQELKDREEPAHVTHEGQTPARRFHDLRHSAASLLIAEGVELGQVRQLLGHSELRVTAGLYAHLQKQTAAKAREAYGCLVGVEHISYKSELCDE